MNSIATFKNVSYRINKIKILDTLSLHLVQGEVTGILGTNGAGKTTFLSLLNGLLNHTSGELELFGQMLPSNDFSIRQKIGVVLQETALYEELTTFENLQFAASLYGVKNPTARIIEVLSLLQLSERSDQVVKELSGGMRRRIAIARALLHDPELLLIDEPTLGVDVEARHAIWQHLRFLKSQGRTIVVATNYLDEAQALCDKAAVLRQGKLIAFDTPHALFSRAGYCIDILCQDDEASKIQTLLKNTKGIDRFENTVTGLLIFITNEKYQKDIINSVMKQCKIEGFKMRAPDLAEVFKSL